MLSRCNDKLSALMEDINMDDIYTNASLGLIGKIKKQIAPKIDPLDVEVAAVNTARFAQRYLDEDTSDIAKLQIDDNGKLTQKVLSFVPSRVKDQEWAAFPPTPSRAANFPFQCVFEYPGEMEGPTYLVCTQQELYTEDSSIPTTVMYFFLDNGAWIYDGVSGGETDSRSIDGVVECNFDIYNDAQHTTLAKAKTVASSFVQQTWDNYDETTTPPTPIEALYCPYQVIRQDEGPVELICTTSPIKYWGRFVPDKWFFLDEAGWMPVPSDGETFLYENTILQCNHDVEPNLSAL